MGRPPGPALLFWFFANLQEREGEELKEVRIQKPESRMYFLFWILASGFWLLDSGFWLLDSGF